MAQTGVKAKTVTIGVVILLVHHALFLHQAIVLVPGSALLWAWSGVMRGLEKAGVARLALSALRKNLGIV